MLCLAVLAANLPSIAQESANSTLDPASNVPPQRSNSDRDDRVQQIGPDTYILLDAEGRPQAMPGMTYEDFLAAWKQLQQVDQVNRDPRFAIQRVNMIGQTRDRHVELQCEITVQLFGDEPVEVALGMPEAILQKDAQFHTSTDGEQTGDGDEKSSPEKDYLVYNSQRGGFVARFAAGHAQLRTVSLSLIVPLLRDAAGYTLSLTCPRTTSSNLTLDINGAATDVNTTSGAVIAQETTRHGVRVVVAGAAGPVQLTWHTPDGTQGAFSTVLNAQGAIRVAIDGRSVRTHTRLTVQSYGSSFDRMRVQLPRGAQLIQDRPVSGAVSKPAYRISLEPLSSNAGATTPEFRRQIVLIEFPEKQRGPVAIDLVTEQPIGMGPGSAVELSGIEVLGAVRQFGDIALQVAPDWQARWDTGPHLRQVDPTEVDPLLQQPGITAAFQYDREAWSLPVRIEARKSRVVVTPEFRMDLASDEARLVVRLTYQVLGARTFNLRVNLNGWELATEPVESGGLVDDERIAVLPDGILELPLKQALSRRAEITFIAKRTVPRDDQRIFLPLPVPVADSVSPGGLVVRTGAEIDLVPDLARSSGLVTRPSIDSSATLSPDLLGAYHFRTSNVETVFAADRIVRSREVSHAVHTTVYFDVGNVRVEQQVDYDVQHVPIEELKFRVPPEIYTNGVPPEFAVLQRNDSANAQAPSGEVPLGVSPQGDERKTTETAAADTFQVSLPQVQRGHFSVVIRYPLDFPNGTGSGSAWPLPLVMPVDGKMTAHRVVCHGSRQVAVSLDTAAESSPWVESTVNDASGSNSMEEFVATQPDAYLPLFVRTASNYSPAETFVDRVWLQTWIAGGSRQERTAFRFRTAGSQVAVELAPQTPEVLEVLLDGDTAQLLSREAGRIVVAMPPDTANASTRSEDAAMTPHTLELRYRLPIRTALLSRHVMTPHQMVGSISLAESYWQVVLPADTHIVRSPPQMTAANMWQWLGSFWGRRPVLAQKELEAWSGASSRGASSHTQNEYLFTALAPISTMEFVTAPRWLIVLVASSSVFGLTLCGIYLPTMRRPWVLGALACALGGLALILPTAALLLAQASALGVVASVLAILIARLVRQPAPWTMSLPASGTRREVTPRPESIVIPQLSITGSTSPTVSLRVPEPE
jgi:hypothetical protein